MEEAYRIFDFLPVHYQNPSQQEYIQFLWQSYEINDQNDQHTFAFFAYHMLYMSVVYSIIWKVKCCRNDEFAHALIGFSADECKEINRAEDWFILHVINERRVFNFLKLINFTDSDLGQFRKPVKERNNAAHSNGIISYQDQDRLDSQIESILRNLEKIQVGYQHMIIEIFNNFLVSSWDPEEREFFDIEEQIEEVLVRFNNLSPSDISHLLTFDISTLEENPHYDEIQSTFTTFQTLYNEE